MSDEGSEVAKLRKRVKSIERRERTQSVLNVVLFVAFAYALVRAAGTDA